MYGHVAKTPCVKWRKNPAAEKRGGMRNPHGVPPRRSAPPPWWALPFTSVGAPHTNVYKPFPTRRTPGSLWQTPQTVPSVRHIVCKPGNALLLYEV